MTGWRAPNAGSQRRALTHAFLFRFFENEVTAGSNDLRGSFLWLLSVLVPPGLCLPFLALMRWSIANYVFGSEGVRRIAWQDKTTYIGFSMIVAAAVGAIVWTSLLIDRRDTLVLGAQPLRARTIVVSKLLALAAYVGLLIGGMHTLASLAYGMLLGDFVSAAFALRGMLAHFVASSLGSAFVLLAVCGLQGLLLASLGPKLFARISPLVQLLLAVAVLESLLALPFVAGSAVRSLEASGVAPLVVHRHGRTLVVHPTAGPESIARAWVPATPPIWFLGVYEEILGTPDPRLRDLARRGIVAVTAALGVVVLTYPLAYRRMAIAAVESPDLGPARHAYVSRFLPALIARDPTSRAAVQFLLATLGRVERHRFVVAMAAGLALAIVVPVAINSIGLLDRPPGWTTVPLLAIPFYVMACLAPSLRFAAVLPGDARASWLFQVVDPDRWRARAGVWRVVFLFGVALIELAFLPVAWHAWGAWFGFTNLVTGLTFGTLLIEVLFWRTLGMPCAEPWRPRPGHLRVWWPLYFFAFLIFTLLAPGLSLLGIPHPWLLWLLLGVIGLATVALRFARHATVFVQENEDDVPRLEVLSLH